MTPRMLLMLGFVALAACTVTTPYEVMGEPFTSPIGTQEARHAQILRAATGLGWTINVDSPGHLLATNNGVTVLVEYTPEGFSLHETNPPPDTDTVQKWNVAVEALEQNILAQSGA